jgi:branched-chain amino acid transport system ATP-binding protein
LAPHRGEILRLDNVFAGYGGKEVLLGISLAVSAGEIVALIGHNGAGKTTVLRSAFGMVAISKGSVSLEGRVIPSPEPRGMLGAGVVYLPQGKRIFDSLSVRDNLTIGNELFLSRDQLAKAIERMQLLFPFLKARLDGKAKSLSGGEKQMVALARAMMRSPRLLLLDEPSLGLTQSLAGKIFERLREIAADSGAGILVVEQKIGEILRIAHRVYVLRRGVVSFSGPVDLIKDDDLLSHVYF